MSDKAQTPEAVALVLAEAFLRADGKYFHEQGQSKAATRAEIAAAYAEATTLVNKVNRRLS